MPSRRSESWTFIHETMLRISEMHRLSLTIAPVQDAPPALMSAIDSHLTGRVDDRPSFRDVLVDLGGDGRPDAIVLL